MTSAAIGGAAQYGFCSGVARKPKRAERIEGIPWPRMPPFVRSTDAMLVSLDKHLPVQLFMVGIANCKPHPTKS